jgi:tRNA-dihydrouridine synthase A
MLLCAHLPPPAERFSVAPMVGHTHRHTRYLLRLLSQRSWLYTEMTHASFVLAAATGGGAAPSVLTHSAAEHPVALQLGGRGAQSTH